MKEKQKVKVLSPTRWLLTLCFSSCAVASESTELNFGEKDLKSFSPALYGSFCDFTEKKEDSSKHSSVPCISILSEKLTSPFDKIKKDAQPSSLLDAEIISWTQLPYCAKIEINLSLDLPFQSKELAFEKPTSIQVLAGHFSIPSIFKKRHLKSLPDFLVLSLKEASDKKLPYLEIIAQQNFYNPIPSIELVAAKISDSMIKNDPMILQHFDIFQEDALFQGSLYSFLTSLDNTFVFPEKYSFVCLTQVPFFSSFSSDPLILDASYFAHYEQNIQLIMCIPSKESSQLAFSRHYPLISLENELFVDATHITSSKIAPVFATNPKPCHQDKLSTKEFVLETAASEIFIAAIHPIFTFTIEKEALFPSMGPHHQLFLSFQPSFTTKHFQPVTSETLESTCDFLAKHSLGAYQPQQDFIVSKPKQSVSYKKGMTLSPNFTFDTLQSPLHLWATTFDSKMSSIDLSKENAIPLTMKKHELWILSLKDDSVQPSLDLQSFYASIPYVPEANIKALNLEKVFFQEALSLSVSPTDLYSNTSELYTHPLQESLGNHQQRKESHEDVIPLSQHLCLHTPQKIDLLSPISPQDLSFFDLPNYLDLLALTFNEPVSLNKTFLEEKIAILEIHPTILDNQLPAEVLVDRDMFTLSNPANHGLENSYLLSYQKALRARLSDYSIIVDKPQDEDRIDPITSNQSPKIYLAGSVQENIPSRASSVSLTHAQRQTTKNLEQLPSVEELCNYNATEDFVHDLHITPNPKGTGYLFSVTLLPQQQKLETNCPQNYIFLIDRSGSIDKTRFQSFKQGVMKSLLYLKDCDTFNIITFDTEMSKMSHESVFATQATKHGAKRYLENQKRGYQYGIPNVPQMLLSLQPLIKKSSLPTTIVLLTSGKTLENYNKELDGPLLKKQLKANKNSFTLFTAGCQDVSDSNMLEMISLLNRGEHMISQTNAAFPRKLAALVKHATYLAASNVHITTANRSQPVKVELYPNSPVAPNLYGDKPYTIVGKIDKLADFDLILQGRFCDNWILIKKKVSFSNARHGGHSILKDFKTFTAYNQYHEYFEDGSIAHLDEAKESLKSSQGHFIR